MSNYKKMLILFVIFILILGIILYLYKEDIANYIQVSVERSGTALENSTLLQPSSVDDTKVLNTESISKSKFRILKNQVPATFLEEKTATSTSLGNKSLFLKP
jgi:uncharacterized membrane protein